VSFILFESGRVIEPVKQMVLQVNSQGTAARQRRGAAANRHAQCPEQYKIPMARLGCLVNQHGTDPKTPD